MSYRYYIDDYDKSTAFVARADLTENDFARSILIEGVTEAQAMAVADELNRLESAVVAAQDYIGIGDSTEDYERLAERFYTATGFMAPGKAQPAAMGGTSYELRSAKFKEWLAADAARIRSTIAAALKGTP